MKNTENKNYSFNKESEVLVEELLKNERKFRIKVSKGALGCNIIDTGINVRGSIEAGLKVSEIGLGCNNFGMVMDQKNTNNVVSSAIDEGITLFDTADVYGNKGRSETYLGKALGKRRNQIIPYPFSGPNIKRAW